MRSTAADRHRLSIAVESGKLLVHVDGPEGPSLEQHLREVRRAATQCGFEVVECSEPVHRHRSSQPDGASR